jgi:hypothetical protein
VAHEFEAWVNRFNEEHAFERNEATPREAWDAQDVPLRMADPDAVRALLRERLTRVVSKQGIKLNKRHFVHPDLIPLVGQEVLISWMPRDYRAIHVYQEDRWICEAVVQDAMSSAEQLEFKKAALAEGRALRKRANDLARSGRTNIAPITGAGERAIETDVIERTRKLPSHRAEPKSHEAERAANQRRARGRTNFRRNQPLEIE